MSEREAIVARITKLRTDLAELENNIPAHSTSIRHIAQIEKLEDEIEALEREMASLS
ncbi:MAG: hypothetical protein KAJ42_17855 [Gemmatimonadetes bacterium]|nr:hypothetical protein [Gemmatimonadota bacterium]